MAKRRQWKEELKPQPRDTFEGLDKKKRKIEILSEVIFKDGKKVTSVRHNTARYSQESQSYEQNDETKKYDLNFLYCHETFPFSEDENEGITVTELKQRKTPDPFADSDDSKDADYIPDDQVDDDSDIILESPVKKIEVKRKFLIYKKKQETQITGRPKQSDQIQCCEYRNCINEVFSTCGKCLSLLCWRHFDDEVSYSNCKNHGHTEFENNTIVHNPMTEVHEINKVGVRQKKNEIETYQLDVQTCEYYNCNQNVQSTCDKCLCFLCLDHFHTQDEENCKNHLIIETIDKRKSTVKEKKKMVRKEKELKNVYLGVEKTQHCEYIDCTKEVYATCEKCACLLCLDHLSIASDPVVLCNYHKPLSTGSIIEVPALTKDGNIRKRKLYTENLESRKEKKKALRNEKTALKKPCDSSCKKQCLSKFSEHDRRRIHKEFNALNYEAKGLYIKGLVDVSPVKTRRQYVKTNIKREAIYVYNLILLDLQRTEVCKTFFLTTLGYNPKNDSRVMSALKNPSDKQKDLRGSFQRKDMIDKNLIRDHVMKYEPCVAHYRREHAPNRFYLPSDININIMYQDFRRQYPHIKISCETYRKVVRHDMNISFANLGHEECEQCAIFKEHQNSHDGKETCEVCSRYETHKFKYTKAREEYKKDVEKAKSDSTTDTIFYSVDLQKVIMLPRIDQYKIAIFCPRIIVFNESFVPLGSVTENNVPFAVLWNETISGRNQEDIISAFRTFLIHKRDIDHVVIWMDNCAAQNKNWALLSFLVDIINCDLIRAQTICLKYFEPGHTFMSADSFHHQVEKSLKQKGKVYDFDDFVDAVKSSNSKKNVVREMQVTDFFDYQDLSSQVRLRKMVPRVYLKNIVYLKAQRGDYKLKYKVNHDDQAENTLDFLMLKYVKKQQIPETRPKAFLRGISQARKKSIIEKLVPLMPVNRRRFWYDLPVSEIDSNDNDDTAVE